MALKTDSNGRQYVDYTDGKTFFQFETSSSSKVMMHIISHAILLFCWVKVMIGWSIMDFYGTDKFNAVMSWMAIGILIAVPVLYWGLNYRSYKRLQKGITL